MESDLTDTKGVLKTSLRETELWALNQLCLGESADLSQTVLFCSGDGTASQGCWDGRGMCVRGPWHGGALTDCALPLPTPDWTAPYQS